MSKLPISQPEFDQLKEHYKAPKTGEHILWKAFSDDIDLVFTKKDLEKNLDTPIGDVAY